MNYLSPQEILYVHYRLAQELGGAQGVYDVGTFKKLAKYIHNNDIFPDKHSKAAALLFGIAKRKPFLDLNKESSLILAKMFLSINKEDFEIGNSSVIGFMINKLLNASLEDIKNIIAKNSVSIKN